MNILCHVAGVLGCSKHINQSIQTSSRIFDAEAKNSLLHSMTTIQGSLSK